MKRVLIIVLIWFLINCVCIIFLGIYIKLIEYQNIEISHSRPFFYEILFSLFMITLFSLPTLVFNLIYFASKKITHIKFILQLYKTYLIYSIIVCLIISATFFQFTALIISFIGLFVSFIVITIFKYLPGEDIQN